MKQYNSFFNKSLACLVDNEGEGIFCLGSSYEDRGVHGLENRLNEMSFLLDAACPGQFVAITTGNYLATKKREYYDNYNNTYYIVRKDLWDKYLPIIIEVEARIYKEYESKLPDYKAALLSL